ncbi:hypothetical protein DFS34DRAFT_597238 [Phlyctochytrium arcticum]|nr:hypothetical protein DFS34DRAFT_597238 [Phlyctochytrium arcticum]
MENEIVGSNPRHASRCLMANYSHFASLEVRARARHDIHIVRKQFEKWKVLARKRRLCEQACKDLTDDRHARRQAMVMWLWLLKSRVARRIKIQAKRQYLAAFLHWRKVLLKISKLRTGQDKLLKDRDRNYVIQNFTCWKSLFEHYARRKVLAEGMDRNKSLRHALQRWKASSVQQSSLVKISDSHCLSTNIRLYFKHWQER